MSELFPFLLEPIVLVNLDVFAVDAPGALWTVLTNIHWVLFGVLVGMGLGVIPGMGGVVTLVVLLPFTLLMDPATAFIVLGAGMGATSFSGSLTAILVNTPGTGSNAPTVLDGYPLTREGRGIEAITASAISSAGGALIGLLIFFLLIPVVIDVALLFGPSEIFWMVMIGLAVLPLVAGERALAGMVAGGLGMLASLIGHNPVTGEYRYIGGIILFRDGLGLVPPMIGLFAVSEMFRLFIMGEQSITTNKITGSRIEGLRAVIRNKWLFVKCSIIGIFAGAIPGVGGSLATFLAYTHAVQNSDTPEEFGKGNIEGVIAPEAANDSKDGGQLFPTLGLGIPGSASTAILIGGFLMHGLDPGPRLLTDHLDIMLIIVFALLFSNILTSIIGISVANVVIKITKLGVSKLFPLILVLGFMATFIFRSAYIDMIVALVFGIFGILLIYLQISRIPFVLAFVLTGLAEVNFYVAYRLAYESYVDAFFTGTLNWILIGLFVVTLATGTLSIYRSADDSVSV